MLADKAAIFTDGRYTLQVRQQVDGAHWSYEPVPESSPADWLKANAKAGARIGYDPWLHRGDWVKKTREMLSAKGAELVAVTDNPIDAIWEAKPQPSKAALIVHPERLAGRSSADKRQAVAEPLIAS